MWDEVILNSCVNNNSRLYRTNSRPTNKKDIAVIIW